MKTYWVYIMTNRSGTLYTGVTGDLARRVYEHRHQQVSSFSSRYKINHLVHAESFSEVRDAIAREKAMKAWLRLWKLRLILEHNPRWEDLWERIIQ